MPILSPRFIVQSHKLGEALNGVKVVPLGERGFWIEREPELPPEMQFKLPQSELTLADLAEMARLPDLPLDRYTSQDAARLLADEVERTCSPSFPFDHEATRQTHEVTGISKFAPGGILEWDASETLRVTGGKLHRVFQAIETITEATHSILAVPKWRLKVLVTGDPVELMQGPQHGLYRALPDETPFTVACAADVAGNFIRLSSGSPSVQPRRYPLLYGPMDDRKVLPVGLSRNEEPRTLR